MDTLTVLSREERQELDLCEKVISLGLNTFFKVGAALETIKVKKLYRQEYDNFEDYCQQKWEFSRFRANQLIASSQVYNNLLTIVTSNETPLPQNEAQTRPLVDLPPVLQGEAWTTAATSASGLPTGKQVQEVAKALKPTNGSKPKPKPPATALESTTPAPPQLGSAPATLEATAPSPKPVKLDGVTKEQVDKAFSLLRLFVVSGYKEFFVSEARKLLKETGKL